MVIERFETGLSKFKLLWTSNLVPSCKGQKIKKILHREQKAKNCIKKGTGVHILHRWEQNIIEVLSTAVLQSPKFDLVYLRKWAHLWNDLTRDAVAFLASAVAQSNMRAGAKQ